MKMAFELNDLKGLLFVVLFTIPSTTSTNYDCKGKSFYCLDSTHFLICVDFGGGVLSTIDDFVLPCPFLTECHESNTYECELPKIVTTTAVFATSVTENSVNSVVPLINTMTTVLPELTTVLPSTEKSSVVPVSEVVNSESNKEILESLKDEFTGGNEHLFEPTKFITTDSIDFNASVDNVNKTSRALVKNDNSTANIETRDSSDNKVNNSVISVPKIIDVTSPFEGLLVTDFITKSLNIAQNNTDNIELNITPNELTKSKNLTSDPKILSTLSPNLNTDAVNVISVAETSLITSTNNAVSTVPPAVTTVLPLSNEKNTVIPALELVTFEPNKEILEKIKDKFTEGKEKKFEHTSLVSPSTVSLSPSVNKINEISTTADKILNPKPGIETSTENTMKITVTENSKNMDVTTSNQELLITDFKEINFTSLNITHNITNIKESIVTTNEHIKSKDLTGDKVLSDKNVVSPINNMTSVPLEVITVPSSTEKNTVIPTFEVVTSKPNKELLESLKDEFTGGNEIMFKPTNSKPTAFISSNPRVDKVNDISGIVDKKTYPKPDISTEDSAKNIDVTPNIVHNGTNNIVINTTVSELTKSEIFTSYEAGDTTLPTSSSNLNDGTSTVSIETTTVLPSTEKNTYTLALEVTTFKLNKEILESLKDEFTGGNEKIFKLTTSVLPKNISLNPSVKKEIEMNISTEKSINSKKSMETSTESTGKNDVTNDPKMIDFGTAVEGILITDLMKNDTYMPKLLNISQTTVNTGELNITENLTSDKAPANKFVTNSNLNSDQRYYLDNVVSLNNQTNYYYSMHNLTTSTITNEVTVDSNVETEKNQNLNTNNITDNIGKNLAPEKQKDLLTNQLVQLKKSTTITPFEISSSTVSPSNHSQMKEANDSELFVGKSNTLNNASAWTTKYKTNNNIDVVYTTYSTTEPAANVADNQTGRNLDVLSNNEANTYRTTVTNKEQTTEVTSTPHTDTTPRETHLFISSDNSLTTSITTHESFSTTVSSTTKGNSITPFVDSITTSDIYVNKKKEEPIDIQVKTTTTHLIDVTDSPQFVVTTSTYNNLSNGRESSLEQQTNITTSDTIYITTSTTTPQSKTYDIKSEHVNNMIITTTENVNTKSSNINGSEDWNNTDVIKANKLSNISSLTTEQSNSSKEVNNITLNYEVSYTSALESKITVSSTTEPSVVLKDQAKIKNQNKIIDSNSVTITSTLSSAHKSNVVTEAMYTTSFTFNENIDNKPTEVPSKLETIINGEIIPEVVTLSQNINDDNTNVKNLTWTQTKSANPALINTQNTAPDLKTPEYIENLKEEKLDIFSTTVKPITEEQPTSENILQETKFTSFTSQGTENPLQFTTEVTKSDYQKIIAKANIPYPTEVIQTGYSQPDYITSKSVTNFKTAIGGAGMSSDSLMKNEINGSNVKDTSVVDNSTIKHVTEPVSHETLHTENTTQTPMKEVNKQSVYQSNILVSPAVVEFTAEQKPNIVANRIALDTLALTGKPSIDNSSRISTEKTSYSLANNKTISETLIIQKPKCILGGTANNGTSNNSIYSTNQKGRDENNTIINEGLQTNIQNMTYAHNISGKSSNKESMNLETTANALEKELVNVDIGGKSKNENENEDNESTMPYGSTSRIELTTPSSLDFKNNKPVINTSYVTPESGKSQTYSTNIGDLQTNQKDNETKTIPVKIKVPRAAIHGNEGKSNSILTFDCGNKTRGKYGDSKDCRKFYSCIGTLQPIVRMCPNHTVFSEINKQCTRNLSHCVRNNQFHCLYEGRFSDYFKDNVYYICVKNNFHGFLRYKLQCQGGYYLNKAIVKCEKKVEIYEYKESVSSVSENSKMSSDQNKSTIKSDESEKSASSDLECKKEGLYPSSNDCRMYYECSKTKKDEYRRKIKKCSTDEVYDKEKKKCVYADSIEC